MRTPAFLKFYGKDMFIFTAGLKNSEKAAIFDGIIHLNIYGFWPEKIKKLCEKNENFSKNFEKISELFSKNLENYEKICERNMQNAKGKCLKNKENQNPVATQSFNTETEAEAETEAEDNKLLTAPQKNGAGSEREKTEPEKIKTGPVKKSQTPLFGGEKFLKKKRELNQLQQFSNEVLAQYEEPMDEVQKGIWFKRNARCLTDILNFCGKDIPLALATIGECADRLQKAGLSGGYEAVCRNLPEYYAEAKKKTEVKNAKNATNANAVRPF